MSDFLEAVTADVSHVLVPVGLDLWQSHENHEAKVGLYLLSVGVHCPLRLRSANRFVFMVTSKKREKRPSGRGTLAA